MLANAVEIENDEVLVVLLFVSGQLRLLHVVFVAIFLKVNYVEADALYDRKRDKHSPGASREVQNSHRKQED